MDAIGAMWVGLAAGSVGAAALLGAVRSIAQRVLKQERGVYRQREQLLMEQRERLMTQCRALGDQCGRQQRMDELQAAYDRGVNDGTLTIARMSPRDRAIFFGESTGPEMQVRIAKQHELALDRGIFDA